MLELQAQRALRYTAGGAQLLDSTTLVGGLHSGPRLFTGLLVHLTRLTVKISTDVADAMVTEVAEAVEYALDFHVELRTSTQSYSSLHLGLPRWVCALPSYFIATRAGNYH